MRKKGNDHFGICFVSREMTFWIQNFHITTVLFAERVRVVKRRKPKGHERDVRKGKRKRGAGVGGGNPEF